MTTDHRSYHHGNLHEALIEAAIAAIEVEGVQNVTLRELCRTLSVTHGAARRHFSDKRSLMDQVAVRGFTWFGDELGDVADDDRGSVIDQLLRLADAQVAYAQRHPALYAWMFEAKRLPDAPAALVEASDRAIARAVAIYARGQATGTLVEGEPQELGLTAFAAVHGLIAVWHDGKGREFLASAARNLVGRIIEGLRRR